MTNRAAEIRQPCCWNADMQHPLRNPRLQTFIRRLPYQGAVELGFGQFEIALGDVVLGHNIEDLAKIRFNSTIAF